MAPDTEIKSWQQEPVTLDDGTPGFSVMGFSDEAIFTLTFRSEELANKMVKALCWDIHRATVGRQQPL